MRWISRSLWVIFIGKWGVWTHATLPVDDRLGMPDKEKITGLRDLVGSLIGPPRSHDDEKAMIVPRRPVRRRSARRTDRLPPSAPGSVGRVPHLGRSTLVGPDGILEVTRTRANRTRLAPSRRCRRRRRFAGSRTSSSIPPTGTGGGRSQWPMDRVVGCSGAFAHAVPLPRSCAITKFAIVHRGQLPVTKRMTRRRGIEQEHCHPGRTCFPSVVSRPRRIRSPSTDIPGPCLH